MNKVENTQDTELEEQDGKTEEEEEPLEEEPSEEEPSEETSKEPSLPEAKPVEVKPKEDVVEHLKNKVNALQRLLDKKKETPKGEFVTREELYKREEKQAVRNVTVSLMSDTDDIKVEKAEIKENWDSIMGHFRVDDRSDASAIEEGIYDAYTIWKRRGGIVKKGDTAINADLSTSRGKGGTSPQTTPSETKTFFPKSQSFDEWFPKKA